MKAALVVAGIAIGSTLAPAASAVEREHHLGVDLGASMLVVNDKGSPDLGAGAGAHWAYGLNDAFNLMVEGAWSLVALGEKTGPKIPATRPAWVANGDVGIGYVFDITQWVPYAGILFGGYALSGGTIHGTKVLPGFEIAIGLDYRLSQHLTAGVALRQHMVTDTSDYPSFSQAFARLEYTWGW